MQKIKLISIIILFFIAGCAKQAQTIVDIPNCDLKQLPPNEEATKKAKPCPPGNPHCQDNPPPVVDTTEKPGCILLDFDGYDYAGGIWGEARHFAGAGNVDQLAAITKVQSYFSSFSSLRVTADESVFNSYPPGHRARVVVTTDYQWYGQVGGVAYLNSYTWLQEEPAFVFSSLLSYNSKYVGDALGHEAGHTLMCNHIIHCEGGVMTSPYEQGNSVSAPIMGASYSAQYPIFNWTGPSITCDRFENSAEVIHNTLKL
jgi:hypothetical protein